MGDRLMKKILACKRIYLLVLIPISLVLTYAAKESSYFAEQIFARHIYKWISQIISAVTGLVPFSIAEILVVVFPVAVLVITLWFIVKMLADKNNRTERLLKGILNVLCVGSIILFSYTILGGLNYYRNTFSSYSKLEIQDSSIEELYSLTQSLALQADDLRAQVPCTDEDGVFKLSENSYRLAKDANEAYRLLAEDYPVLSGFYGSPKPVILSGLMSTTEITGIFFPFTMEANVNVDIPDYSIPSTMLHELAHLRGFMREDEANFLAYLAGMKSDNVEFRYSSTMLALVIAGNALYEQNPDMYFEIRDLYSEGVLKDIRANSAYWQKYEDTVISTVSNKINDTYLKANAQADGVKSYGRMLDLLLAKYRQDQEGQDNPIQEKN
jgi:hypothetical protein